MTVESLRTSYVRLFDVRLLHHYWLDEGRTLFERISDSAVKEQRLLTYDVRRFLEVAPHPATAGVIAGLRGVFRMTGVGFFVAVPADAVVDSGSTFEFHLMTDSPGYDVYTSLTLRPRPVVEIVDAADPDHPAQHIYKENIPVLSNLTGASKGSGETKRLFLSRPYENGVIAGDGVEAIVTSGNSLHQLTGDPPNAPFHLLGLKSELPVYVHQGDVPPILAPAGTTGAPARGIECDAGTPRTVAAVIRLSPRRADDGSFSFTLANGTPRTPTRVFEVHIRNRWTTWRYRDRRSGAVTSTESEPFPLTYFGNPGTKQKPSIGAVEVERGAGSQPKVTRLVSDIYA